MLQKNHIKASKPFSLFISRSLAASISRFYADIEVQPNSIGNGNTPCDKSQSKSSELNMLVSCDEIQACD